MCGCIALTSRPSSVKHDAVNEDIKTGINQEVLFAHVVILGHLEAIFQQAPDLGNKPVLADRYSSTSMLCASRKSSKALFPGPSFALNATVTSFVQRSMHVQE